MQDFNVMLAPDGNSKGYILEVDLSFCVCTFCFNLKNFQSY